MIFSRTLRGLSNQYIFFKVNAIAFIEGGTDTFTLSQILSGADNPKAIDILFWQRMFAEFIPERTIHFRAIGSKSTLVMLADNILSGKLTNVYVAMDRDHDKINKTLRKGPGVLFTFGYSWENDAWCKESIQLIFRLLCPISKDITDTKTDMNCCFSDFIRNIRWAVYADVLLSASNMSFFPRQESEFNKLIPLDPSGRPAINREQIHNILSELRLKRSSKAFAGKRIYFDPACDCFGHLYRNFCFRLTNYLLRKHFTPSLTGEHADALAIDSCVRLLQQGKIMHLKKHYQRQFSKL
ncbi:DUF4435 domain-containing protein [Chloroflexota bacterium]